MLMCVRHMVANKCPIIFLPTLFHVSYAQTKQADVYPSLEAECGWHCVYHCKEGHGVRLCSRDSLRDFIYHLLTE